jgi:hypothetical protein
VLSRFRLIPSSVSLLPASRRQTAALHEHQQQSSDRIHELTSVNTSLQASLADTSSKLSQLSDDHAALQRSFDELRDANR